MNSASKPGIVLLYLVAICCLSPLPCQGQLLDFYGIPDSGSVACFEYLVDSPARTFFEKRAFDPPFLVVERYDQEGRLVEYRKEEISAEGVDLQSFASYIIDSTGRAIPVFGEILESGLFLNNWKEDRIVRSWTEPRRMDSRMSGLRVEIERILLPGSDTLQTPAGPAAAIQINDLLRLQFIGGDGEVIGEDFILDFISYGEDLGIVRSRRQYSDGSVRIEALKKRLSESDWKRLTNGW